MSDGDGHIRFEVFGEPRPQGSKAPHSGAVESESPGKMGSHQAWRDVVSLEARRWATANGLTQPVQGPVEVTLWFWRRRPKSYPRWRWLWWTKPDADKLTRAVLDSLSGIVFDDDARVSDLHVHKRESTLGGEGVEVAVHPLGAIEKDLGDRWAAEPRTTRRYPDIDDLTASTPRRNDPLSSSLPAKEGNR